MRGRRKGGWTVEERGSQVEDEWQVDFCTMSVYLQVSKNVGKEGEIWYSVRVGDHPQAEGGGWSNENGYRHGESEFSLSPTELRWRDVIGKIERMV